MQSSQNRNDMIASLCTGNYPYERALRTRCSFPRFSGDVPWRKELKESRWEPTIEFATMQAVSSSIHPRI